MSLELQNQWHAETLRKTTGFAWFLCVPCVCWCCLIRRRLDFDFLVSRGWIRIFTFRCPEVGSYFVTFVVVAAAAVSVVIWRYAIGRSLSIWNARMMQLHIFLWSHSRRTRARSSSSFVPLADFKLQLRLRDMMGELSRGVRGVVFVFDKLMNFKFVFSHLDTFDDHPLGQRPSLGLRLGPVCGRLPGSLSRREVPGGI